MNDQARPRRRWSWMWIVLVISLAINLAVAAALITFKWHGGGFHHRGGFGLSHVLPRSFFRDLDRQRRRELLAGFAPYREEFRGHRLQMAERALAVARALRARPYDEAAVAGALDAYLAGTQPMLKRGREIAGEFVARLSDDERLRLADEIVRRVERTRRRHHRWHED